MSDSSPEEKPAPEVYKVIGAPGTGKTTRVVGNPELPDETSLVMENMEEYSFEEQMIVTYTNAGTDEAAERLSQIIDEPKYLIDDRVTTIHGQCYRLLDLEYDKVVRNWHKKKFCERYDLDFGWDDDADDIMAADKAAGNAFFDIFSWLQSNREPIENWEHCPGEWTGDRDFVWVAERWIDYKDQWGLTSFGDMIEEVVEWGRRVVEEEGLGPLFADEDTPDREVFEMARVDTYRDPEALRGRGPFIDTKVLYVDEVQDLTPLQWDWYLLQKLVCEKVYIGGDDDQTIYGWAGANPDFMLDEEGDFEVLDKTYRIPSEVWNTCDGVVRQLDKRQEKEVSPHGEGGEVITLENPSGSRVVEYLDGDDTFLLFRARYMINEFTETLHYYGIPYENMSTFETWEDDIVVLRDALAKIENGAPSITGNEYQMMIEYADEEIIHRNNQISKTDEVLGNLGGVDMETVHNTFTQQSGNFSGEITASGFLDHCEEVNYYQTQAIIGNIKQGHEDRVPSQLRIGTIHSSKGKEAETVVLALDSTKTILSNMRGETMDVPDKKISDAERRVYYVGMTRASERLVLAEGIVDNEMSIRLKDLLEDYEPEQSQRELSAEQTGNW